MIIKSRIQHLMSGLAVMTVLMTGACSGDKPLEPEPRLGAEYQITVVFAPGQLGDKGYADNVMLGVGLLNDYVGKDMRDSTRMVDTDSCNVQFISTFDTDDTRKVLKSWAINPVNPFYEGEYKRRLLVLTEFFMIEWLDDIKDYLRPDDEVLLLKVNETDVQQTALKYGLVGRLHGLNISAASSIRKYCSYMNWSIEALSDFYNTFNIRVIPYYRLYDTDAVTYRDSVYETLAQELGDTTEIRFNSILRKTDTSTYSVLLGSNVIQTAYQFAQRMYQDFNENGYYFAITDLGSGKSGWNYYVFGQNGTLMYEMLMLDTDEVVTMGNCYVFRRWDEALYRWGKEWMLNPAGCMPRMKLYTNGEMCEDNIPDVEE